MRLEFYKVRLPFKSPFTTSFGTEDERVGYVFTLENEGIRAFSECVTSEAPLYSYEDNDTAMHVIRKFLAPMISGLPTPDEFTARAQAIKGHNMAKAALEMLLWDYHAKAEGRPMHQYIGESKGYADVGISIGIDRPENLLKAVEAAVQRGYRRVKLKIKRGMEHQILGPVRDRFPDIVLSADANNDYTLKDLDVLRSLDRYNLVYIEQPLDHEDIIDHAKLRKEISTPICLDESITSPDKARKAFEVGAADVINIKPGRLGGFGPSLEVVRIVRENRAHCWVGGMLETGIGRAFNVAFASLRDVDYPGDTSPNDKYFERDIVLNPFSMEDGRIRPNAGPGIGVTVDMQYLRRMSVDYGYITVG